MATVLERGRLLDEAGIDKLVVSDHVVFGERLEEYGRPEVGGQAGGKQPTGPDGHWLEPLTTLAILAGMTERIRLGTNILIAALRRPVVLAQGRRPPSTCSPVGDSTSASASAGNGRSTRPPVSRSRAADDCSITRWRCVGPCGPSEWRTTTSPSSRSNAST